MFRLSPLSYWAKKVPQPPQTKSEKEYKLFVVSVCPHERTNETCECADEFSDRFFVLAENYDRAFDRARQLLLKSESDSVMIRPINSA